MTAGLPSFKAHFARALAAADGRIHLAAHSHHLWPDASFAGQCQAWQDAATLWDAKWQHVLGTLLPAVQRQIARRLGLDDPAAIAIAPNTHDLLRRLLSACPPGRAPRVLTTDGEFHTASRQFARLAEDGLLRLTQVAVQPFADFPARFAAAAASGAQDLVFFSHVFFGSGYAVPDPARLVAAVPHADTLIAIDGYHGFMAVPTDLAAIRHRAFYLAGGYKYAMAGEGVCFLHCPPGVAPRPRDPGWFAGFGALAATPNAVGYAPDGSRFMGATFDPSGLYRLHAVLAWLEALGLSVADIHARAVALQQALLMALHRHDIPGLRAADLVLPAGHAARGNFLAFASGQAAALQARLEAAGIITDRRGDTLRIGFGLYHDIADIPGIAARIAAAVGC